MHGTGNKCLYVSDSPSLFVAHYPERVNHTDSIAGPMYNLIIIIITRSYRLTLFQTIYDYAICILRFLMAKIERLELSNFYMD